jgi:hypothetical protein
VATCACKRWMSHHLSRHKRKKGETERRSSLLPPASCVKRHGNVLVLFHRALKYSHGYLGVTLSALCLQKTGKSTVLDPWNANKAPHSDWKGVTTHFSREHCKLLSNFPHPVQNTSVYTVNKL